MKEQATEENKHNNIVELVDMGLGNHIGPTWKPTEREYGKERETDLKFSRNFGEMNREPFLCDSFHINIKPSIFQRQIFLPFSKFSVNFHTFKICYFSCFHSFKVSKLLKRKNIKKFEKI